MKRRRKLRRFMAFLLSVALLVPVYSSTRAVSNENPFTPGNVVNLNVKYQYAKTGSFQGIDAASPSTLEGLFEKKNGNYEFDFYLHTVEGFSVVLNSTPLDAYLVNPPTGDETPQELNNKFENGDFNVDIKKHKVYYYQELFNDVSATPDLTQINPTYENIYSDEYNQAWDEARLLEEDDYTIQAYCGTSEESGHVGNHGANFLMEPKLKVTLTQDQLEKAIANGLELNIGYHRNPSWYTVKHWVPENLSGLTPDEIAEKDSMEKDGVKYVLMDTDNEQGRVGALTRATAKIGGIYDVLEAKGFSQKLIIGGSPKKEQNVEFQGTVVDIYYKAADSYLVMFNTSDTYIPRQDVPIGNKVDFPDDDSNPTRQGYTFGGWKYLKKDATPDAEGRYDDADYITVSKVDNQYDLTITHELISSKAMLQKTSGVPALHLYPIWIPSSTKVSVNLWVENLTGTDDVSASAQGGDSSYYEEKYRSYSAVPVTHRPDLEGANDHYSNVHDFTIDDLTTDMSLKNNDELLAIIQEEVTSHFNQAMGSSGTISNAQFYSQYGFNIIHEANGKVNYTTTASADGHTKINVYFTRNIYTLKFHYFGTVNKPQFILGGDYKSCVAINTNGFSYAGADKIIQNGDLNFDYKETPDGAYTNKFMRHGNNKDFPEYDMPVPKTITISAKYGADLRDVWPTARSEERVSGMKNLEEGIYGSSYQAKMISWATTDGKYRDEAVNNIAHDGEPTIMGSYATMDAEVIADPLNQNTQHHLVAYWAEVDVSNYRYNHCYEVPGLTDRDVAYTVRLYNGSDSIKDSLYLFPVNTPAISKFGFEDMMKVNYNSSTHAITYGVSNGEYYAMRKNGDKYYAIAQQENVTSTNYIKAQNPSARQHMTKVNDVADHTTQWQDNHGRTWNGGDGAPVQVVGDSNNPYDLYFYYNRDQYTITYYTLTNGTEYGGSEVELGHIDLPYGAYVKQKDYAFVLNQTDNNQDSKYSWITPDGDLIPVCPDRNPSSSAQWEFSGWALGPSSVNMKWENSEYEGNDNFHLESNLNLYAIWNPPIHIVEFHLNYGNGETFTQKVPANTVYSTLDTILDTVLQPDRPGYSFIGWYKSNALGQPIDEHGNQTDIVSEMTPFSLDSVIIDDVNVAAVWQPISEKKYHYKVYYVTKDLKEGDSIVNTIQLDENENVVKTGGETYYVLDSKEFLDQTYVENQVLNLSVKGIAGYTPKVPFKTINITDPDEYYNLAFIYEPQITYKYKVQFVEAGTESSDEPKVIYSRDITADYITTTPQLKDLDKDELEYYYLVNKVEGGYTSVDSYEELMWLDKDRIVRERCHFATNEIPEVVTYLVEPVYYTITYRTAEGSPQSAIEAVANLVGSGEGKNPDTYKFEHEPITLINPESVKDDDNKWWHFKGWTIEGETQEPTMNMVIGKDVRRALTLVAHWEQQKTGNLTITNTVEGELGNRQQDFSYTVTLNDPLNEELMNGTYGDLEFTNGKATFTLKHGETKTISNLPDSVTYTVTQESDPNYDITYTGASGNIKSEDTVTAAFTNTRKAVVDTGLNDPMNPNNMLIGLIMITLCGIAYILFTERKRRDNK